jgi:hypothetical protein
LSNEKDDFNIPCEFTIRKVRFLVGMFIFLLSFSEGIVGAKVSSRATKGFLKVLLHILIDYGLEKYKKIILKNLKIKMATEFMMAVKLFIVYFIQNSII